MNDPKLYTNLCGQVRVYISFGRGYVFCQLSRNVKTHKLSMPVSDLPLLMLM